MKLIVREIGRNSFYNRSIKNYVYDTVLLVLDSFNKYSFYQES